MYAWLTMREMHTFRRGAFWLHMFLHTHSSHLYPTSSPYSKFCSGRWGDHVRHFTPVPMSNTMMATGNFCVQNQGIL